MWKLGFHYHITYFLFLLTGLGSGLDGVYTVTFLAGETTVSLDIPLYDDSSNEDIQLRIISSSLPSGVSVSNDQATIIIIDDVTGKSDF